MADKKATDRLASDLLAVLREAFSKPLPGTAQTQPQPQVDEDSLLDSIKEFLTQSLPGTKDEEEQAAPAAPQVTSAEPQPSVAIEEIENEKPAYEGGSEPVSAVVGPEDEGDWEAMLRRHEVEREEMQWRHEQEREEMHHRHEQERGAIGYERGRDREEAKHRRELEREAREREHERAKEARGRGRGRGTGHD